MAWFGTTRAFDWMLSLSATRTNSPGQSLRFWFGKVPLSRRVPVVESTVLSIKVSSPVSGEDESFCGDAITSKDFLIS